jgi:hypothetical protein
MLKWDIMLFPMKRIMTLNGGLINYGIDCILEGSRGLFYAICTRILRKPIHICSYIVLLLYRSSMK